MNAEPLQNVFPTLFERGFDLYASYHAGAILATSFPDAAHQLDRICAEIEIPIAEMVGGGGGEASVTQRLRKHLHNAGWRKRVIEVEKNVGGRKTYAASHEVDHFRDFTNGSIGLEIEWNNKDPFFDRDLDHFQRLHADSALSIGIVVTRGSSFQNSIERELYEFAVSNGIASHEDFEALGLEPTRRQKRGIDQRMSSQKIDYAAAWARNFAFDKFGSATTHWDKLQRRLVNGVGAPCPVIALGIPISVVSR